jgi:hypothetical protein
VEDLTPKDVIYLLSVYMHHDWMCR